MFLPMLAATALAAAAPAGGPCIDALCGYRALDPWFDKLAEARTRRGRPLHILQIGDSHTAGDAITGTWRDILQARYGGGGRGVLPPGRPYDGYAPRGVSVTMSPGWRIASIFGAAAATPRPPIGLAGFSLTAERPGAHIAMTAEPAQRFNRFTICAIAQPDAGTLVVQIGAQVSRIDLDSATMRAECRTLATGQTETIIDVGTEGGPVTITSWASFRDEGGVALSNLGVVGAQQVHFSRTDDGVLAEELRAYDPDLIVIAYGTNEGFAPRFSPFEYEITLRTQISRIRRLAGRVPILLLGAPDASSRRTEMLTNAPGVPSAPCAEPVTSMVTPVLPPVAVIAPKPIDTGGVAGVMARLRADEGDGNAPAVTQPAAQPPQPVMTTRWIVSARPLFPPAGLKAVRDVQRRVAAALNVAFWDWEARMGGRCAAVKWTKADPPLMRGDYVHFNSAGGREIGSRLQIDLDRAANALSQR